MTTARESLARQLHETMKATPSPEANNRVNDLLDRYRVQAKPGTEVQPGITARESLGKAVVALWKRGPKDLERSVDALLDKYRMQLKREGGGAGDDEEGAAPKAPKAPAAVKAPAAAKPAAPPAVAAPKAGANTRPGGGTVTIKSPVPALAPRTPAAAAKAPAVRPAVEPAAPPAGRKTQHTQQSLPPPRPGGGFPAPMAPRAAPQSVTPLFPGTPTGPSRRSECPKCKSRGVVLARSYTQEEYFSCIYCGWQAFKPFEEANADSPLAARLLSQRPSLPKRKEDGEDDDGVARKRSIIADDDDDVRGRSVISDAELQPRGPAVRPDDGDDDGDLAKAGMHEVDDLDDAEDGDGLDSLGGDEDEP